MNEAPSSEGPAPQSLTPVLRAAWLLRATALASVVGTVLAVILEPGMRGNVGERAMLIVGRASWSFAYFMCGLLCTALILACYELSKAVRLPLVPRAVAIFAGGFVLAVMAPALLMRVPTWASLAVTLAAAVAAIAGAWTGLGASHTRAVAAVVMVLAMAALLRAGAWELAAIAGNRPSPSLYSASRGIATAAVVFEGLGQMIAATWLGTRSRVAGLSLSWVAIGGAFFLTWGAARGASVSAPFWQVLLHTALADAAGLPPPFMLTAIATFLVPSAIMLALVAALQPRQVAAVVAALALALLARGSFDAPLRALEAATAGLWLLVARGDDRAMWKALMAQHRHDQAER